MSERGVSSVDHFSLVWAGMISDGLVVHILNSHCGLISIDFGNH